MDIKRIRYQEQKSSPPKTIRHCCYCKNDTVWVYNPYTGHSQCSICGLRRNPISNSHVNTEGKVIEKEEHKKDIKKHKGGRQNNQNQPFLVKLINKKVVCVLSNSETLEGTLDGTNQYEIVISVNEQHIIIFKHALISVKEIKEVEYL